MFSWLSTQIPEYPDTLNLKMYAHIHETGLRPHFMLEPLSRQYHQGITQERVKEIMLARLRGNE
jgi:transposase